MFWNALEDYTLGLVAGLTSPIVEATGGKDSSDLSVAGAEYGAGYCDAQCYTTPFINGLVGDPRHRLGVVATKTLTKECREISMGAVSVAMSLIYSRPTPEQHI